MFINLTELRTSGKVGRLSDILCSGPGIRQATDRGVTMSQNAQSLGSRLRQLRLANGKSQSELATSLGVSRSTVAQMELGNRMVRAADIDRLAAVTSHA